MLLLLRLRLLLWLRLLLSPHCTTPKRLKGGSNACGSKLAPESREAKGKLSDIGSVQTVDAVGTQDAVLLATHDEWGKAAPEVSPCAVACSAMDGK